MLIPSFKLLGIPVMSLQTGGRLATTKSAVIDPRTLAILAFELEGPSLDEVPSFLVINDIREIGTMGCIVDSSEEFVGVNDVLKIKEVYDFHFALDGIAVKSQQGKRIGKVIGYTIEPDGFIIKQLQVRRPLLKSFTDTELLIDRKQVVEISNDVVIIKDETEPVRSHVKSTASAYTNPFRVHAPAPQHDTINHQ